MATTLTTDTTSKNAQRQLKSGAGASHRGPNWLAGLGGVIWLAIVIIPLYWIVITSFQTQSSYFVENPFKPPTSATLDNYRAGPPGRLRPILPQRRRRHDRDDPAGPVHLLDGRIGDDPPRNRAFLRSVNSLFLMGLAIPLQANIITVDLILIRIKI